MPPRRRAGNNTTRSQSTLAFGSQARVTKPVTAPSKAKHLDSLPSLSDKSVSATPEPQVGVTPTGPSTPHVTELVVRQPAEVQAPQTEQDRQALKLNKQDIWRYWQTQEQIRLAPRGRLSWPRTTTWEGNEQEADSRNSTPRRTGCRGEDPKTFRSFKSIWGMFHLSV
jgi:hypothetical protein